MLLLLSCCVVDIVVITINLEYSTDTLIAVKVIISD